MFKKPADRPIPLATPSLAMPSPTHRFSLAALVALALGLALSEPARALDETEAPEAETAETVLADLQAHGYPSPLLALERLEQAAPATDADIDLRWRHASAMTELAWRVSDKGAIDAGMARLQAMAQKERCSPCATALLMRQTQVVDLADTDTLRQRMTSLAGLSDPTDPQLQFDLAATRATAELTLGNYESAIAEALKASEIATLHNRPADQVTALGLLAVSNSSRRDLRRAIDFARQGITLARRIGFHYARVRLLVNHSYSLATLKENTERQAVLEELLPLTAARGLQRIRVNTLINLAALSNDIHDYKRAVDYAQQAEQASNRKSDPNSYAFTIVNRGVALVHLGRTDEGLALVKAAVDIAEKTGDKRELADLVEQLVDALETAGRPQAALAAMRRWVTLNNELTTTQREAAVTQLQEKFAAQQRTREIENLKLDNTRRDTELQLRAWRERAWAAAAVMVALMAFITWQRLAKSRTINRGLRRDVARLADESHHDPLTGACNRRFGEALLQRLESDGDQQPEGRRRAVSLLLLDVDHFKRVNDGHGHAAGDAVLVQITQRLQDMLRDGDAVVRWGGEEFLLILPGTDEAGLQVVAERALAAIGDEPVELSPGKHLAVRASAGGVVWRAGGDARWVDCLALADAALYCAKADGRNRVLCALSQSAFTEAELAHLPALAEQGRVQLKTVSGVALPGPAAVATAPAEALPA